MRQPYIPIYDPRDPACPPDYDPEAEWDAYLDECDRRYDAAHEDG